MKPAELKDFIASLKECASRGDSQIQLPVSQSLCDFLTDNDCQMLWRSLIAGDYFWNEKGITWQYLNGKLIISGGLIVNREPVLSVKCISDMKAKLLDIAKQGVDRFFVFMPPEMLKGLRSDKNKKMNLLLQDIYVRDYTSKSWENAGILYYSKFVIYENCLDRSPSDQTMCALTPPTLTSLQAVQGFVHTMASMLAQEISFLCTPDVFQLLSEGGYPSSFGEPIARMPDLLFREGIMHFNTFQWKSNYRFSIYNITYYPGFKVSRALLNEKLSLLPREKYLLSAARKLMSSITATDPAEKVLWISHKLGEKTEYIIDEITEESDCAYGPLINHQANCDGFSDAFYLCATLAGIQVRYQYGDSAKPGENNTKALHMWNLVLVHDQWLMLDVTWDRIGNMHGLEWQHCMIGYDRAKLLYRWNRDMLQDLAPVTDYHRSNSIYEYPCNSLEEIIEAFVSAVQRKTPLFYLFLTNQNLSFGKEDLQVCMQAGGIKECRYSAIPDLRAVRVELNYS